MWKFAPTANFNTASDEIEALQQGDGRMLVASLSEFGEWGLHAVEPFDLPFIFPGRDISYRITDGNSGNFDDGMDRYPIQSVATNASRVMQEKKLAQSRARSVCKKSPLTSLE
ncbi:MAG: hypothetical protein WA632_14170 [Gallionella sp.]